MRSRGMNRSSGGGLNIVIAVFLLLGLAGAALAQGRPAPARMATPAKREVARLTGPGGFVLASQLQFQACYVKETTDRAWQIRIAGSLPRGPGLHALVFNEAGDLLHRGEIAYGNYSPDKPFIVNVRADGKAQQYVIKLVGQQDNTAGITLPITNLPFEVYGEHAFTFGPGSAAGQKPMASFQVTAANPSLHFDGWKGNYRILDEAGTTLFDAKDKALAVGDPAKKHKETNVEMIVTGLQPGKTYWIEPYSCGYVNIVDGKIYYTMEPQRWFEPTLAWSFKDRPWWKGIVDVTAK